MILITLAGYVMFVCLTIRMESILLTSVRASYVRSTKCSVPESSGKDVQGELSFCETMQSKCVLSQYRSSKSCGVCM